MKKFVEFKVKYDSNVVPVKTYEGEYRNLMALLIDKFYIDCFGECGGMGRCATCIIELQNCEISKSKLESNEGNTLRKAGILNDNLRLSCQILITNEINNALIIVQNMEIA